MIYQVDSDTFREFLDVEKPEFYQRIKDIFTLAKALAAKPSDKIGVIFLTFSLQRIDHNSRLLFTITVNWYSEIEVFFTGSGIVKANIRDFDFWTIGYIAEVLNQLQISNLFKRT